MRLSVLELLHARQQAVLGTRMPHGPRQRRAGDTQPRLLHSSPPQSFPWSPASAPPIHCTQCGPLRSPELLINRELQTQHRFIQTAQTAQGRERATTPPGHVSIRIHPQQRQSQLGLVVDNSSLGAVEVCRARREIGRHQGAEGEGCSQGSTPTRCTHTSKGPHSRSPASLALTTSPLLSLRTSGHRS